jgi:acyl-CoA synthetase (AMP-forming)/AMP-acid ligase II
VRRTWTELDRRANGVATALLEAGLERQAKVAHYLYNGPEYLESLFGIWKAALVPVNTNYRYTGDELVYLWDNADVEAVVFHGTFATTIATIRDRLPRIRKWLWVDDASSACPSWAIEYEAVVDAGASSRAAIAPGGRSGDDLYLLYTGGTTGSPKGVMWRQDDLFVLLNASAKVRYPADGNLDDVAALITKPGPVFLPACPLMHGTGAFAAFGALSSGGCVTTLTERHFDVIELLDTIERERVQSMAIVGDAFAKPMLRELDAAPDRWDISSLRVITSSGVVWSAATKEGLLRHNPRLILADSLGSSEAIGMAASVTTNAARTSTAKFQLSDESVVITDDDRIVAPGSGEIGMLALRGRTPIGYYKDEAKSRATFRVVDGVRYSIPGDYATIEADGTLVLLGRGSACINTGGEKVFPEEVEEVLKEHAAVRDAIVVGRPDERFGETVTAVVELEAPVEESELVAHVRNHLAAYKAPRHVYPVAALERAANGKVDYRRWKDYVASR